jgi:DUF971 family protein
MQRLPRDLTPTSYELDEERATLHISWSDGHESAHGYEALRRACPCAHCAGEGAFPGTMTATTPLSQDMLTLYELQPVGRYGLTPIWGDGHKTGIYTYERLRGMCECDACRAMPTA